MSTPNGIDALTSLTRNFVLIKTILLPSAVSICYINFADLITHPHVTCQIYFNNFASFDYVYVSQRIFANLHSDLVTRLEA